MYILELRTSHNLIIPWVPLRASHALLWVGVAAKRIQQLACSTTQLSNFRSRSSKMYTYKRHKSARLPIFMFHTLWDAQRDHHIPDEQKEEGITRKMENQKPNLYEWAGDYQYSHNQSKVMN